MTGASRVIQFAGIGAVNGLVDLERVAIVDNHTTGVALQSGTIEDSLIARNVGRRAAASSRTVWCCAIRP